MRPHYTRLAPPASVRRLGKGRLVPAWGRRWRWAGTRLYAAGVLQHAQPDEALLRTSVADGPLRSFGPVVDLERQPPPVFEDQLARKVAVVLEHLVVGGLVIDRGEQAAATDLQLDGILPIRYRVDTLLVRVGLADERLLHVPSLHNRSPCIVGLNPSEGHYSL